MMKEFGAEDYAKNAHVLLKATSTVVSNLAFNAAGLNAGNENVHREKLLKSIILLKNGGRRALGRVGGRRGNQARHARARGRFG